MICNVFFEWEVFFCVGFVRGSSSSFIRMYVENNKIEKYVY